MRKVYALSFVVSATLALAAAPARAADGKDSRLGKKVEEQLRQDERLRDYVLEAEVDNGVATLTGKVALDAAKEHAEEVARIPGVRRVNNQIEVAAMSLEDRLALQEQLGRRRAQVPVEASAGGSPEQLRAAQAGQTPPEGAPQPTPTSPTTRPDQPAPAEPIAPSTPSETANPSERANPGEPATPANQGERPAPGEPPTPAQPSTPTEGSAAPAATGSPSQPEVDQNGFVQLRVLPTPAGDPQKMVAGEEITADWVDARIMGELEGEEALARSNVKVETSNDFVVTLKGKVATEYGRQRAVDIAKNTKGVNRVDDQLIVSARR